jgi:hypothetical protein
MKISVEGNIKKNITLVVVTLQINDIFLKVAICYSMYKPQQQKRIIVGTNQQ